MRGVSLWDEFEVKMHFKLRLPTRAERTRVQTAGAGATLTAQTRTMLILYLSLKSFQVNDNKTILQV